MTTLLLTEYRGDGNFYPLLIVVGDNSIFSVFEVDLNPVGPFIVGQTKSLGKGALLIGVVPGKNLTVRETVAEIRSLLMEPKQ